MLGTMFCQYETPCGWCAKFDKLCNAKACKPKSNGSYSAKALKERDSKKPKRQEE